LLPLLRLFDGDTHRQRDGPHTLLIVATGIFIAVFYSSSAAALARSVRLQHPAIAGLRLAEVQVFGDMHRDPLAYPRSVTDPGRNDGLFRARVANLVANPPRYVCIVVRGSLPWSGAPVGKSTDPVNAKFNCAATQLVPAQPTGQLPSLKLVIVSKDAV